MATLQCSLCGNAKGETIESFKTSEIRKGYEELCGHDFDSEFQGVSSLALLHCDKCGLKYFEPIIMGSSDFYTTLQENLDWYYLTQKNEYSHASKFIKKNFNVLEVGCGEGSFSNFAQCENYVGLELNPGVADVTRAKGLNIRFESLEDHSKQNLGRYDVVCAFQVLEHIADVKSFIENSSQCLKKGGLLILSTPNGDSFLKFASNVVLNMPPHHQTWWTEDVFKNLAARFDFEIIEIHHEKLSEEHRIFYFTTMINRSLNRVFRRAHKTLDYSLSQKLFSKVSRLCAKGLNQIWGIWGTRPMGFSITAVLRRKS